MNDLEAYLAIPEGFSIERVIHEGQVLTLVVKTNSQSSNCPDCGQASLSVHGYYWRCPWDLPVTQCALQLQIRVRRFRCANPVCPRRTFAEDLSPYLPRFSRRTKRAAQTLTHLGFEFGGQAGARIARHLRLATSRCTQLRLIRRSQLPSPSPVEVLGVDDWAFCRGERYGTLLVDLERHRVLDLLPDTEVTTFAAWLQAQPHVRVISRDRGGNYAEGARQGAPNALQVADRWHLLRNLWDALVIAFDLHTSALRRLSVETTPSTGVVAQALPAIRLSRRPKVPPSPLEQARASRRQHWENVFAQAQELLAQGVRKRVIAKQLNVSLSLVKKYSHLQQLPKKQSPKSKPLLIQPYLHQLHQWLQQEPLSTAEAFSRIRALGFRGSHSTVYKALVRLRYELHLPSPLLTPKLPVHTIRVTPRQLASWVLAPNHTPLQQDLLQQACDLHPLLDVACGLALDFVMILREQLPQHLLPWLEAAQLSDIPSLKQLAQGFLKDFEAVYNACSQPWSNGQVEGQVHRLKLLKRQMYGRAHFDLLRLRVLYTGDIST